MLNKVRLVLLYDYNVIEKEVLTIKLLAYLRGFFWKYGSLFQSKHDFIVVDAI